ncbi:MAG: hypothetical protein KAT58_02580 [candidate division Zixibacteria bacterium]|nr:hypothetical protein [candidate division Zixibacteria bacterium]
MEMLIGILGTFIAAVAVYFKYRQYKHSKQNKRVDLYPRRRAVYDAIMGFIAGIIQRANADSKEAAAFLHNTKEADFLFGKEIKEHINELYRKAKRLQLLEFKLGQLPVGEELSKMVNEEDELLEWFSKQFGVTEKRFKKYLNVSSAG